MLVINIILCCRLKRIKYRSLISCVVFPWQTKNVYNFLTSSWRLDIFIYMKLETSFLSRKLIQMTKVLCIFNSEDRGLEGVAFLFI